jgi:hypothetical protein
MLSLFALGVMLICAYVYFREGLFTAVCMGINVFLAGLVAFNFFEPLAGFLESMLDKTFLQDYLDFLCLVGVFALTLGVLRALTNKYNNEEVHYQPMMNAIGAAVVALGTGYLLAGFLICAMETLPWHQNFLGFEPYRPDEPSVRRVMPPDRVWLALMQRASQTCLSRSGPPAFDKEGTFESYYMRFRRYADAPGEGQK